MFLTLEAWLLFTKKTQPKTKKKYSYVFKALLLGWQTNAGKCSSAEVVQKKKQLLFIKQMTATGAKGIKLEI